MAPLKHSPRAVAPGADAGALVALISRRTGRPLEVAPLGGHPHALCESRGATALCEGVAADALPATALFQLERKAGGAVGFRALGAGGNMLQATPRRGEAHRATNSNFGSWETWRVGEGGMMVNAAFGSKVLAADVEVVCGALTAGAAAELEKARRRWERDAELRVRSAEGERDACQRRERELEAQLGALSNATDTRVAVMEARLIAAEAATKHATAERDEARAAAAHMEARMRQVQKEAAAIRTKAEAKEERLAELEARVAAMTAHREALDEALGAAKDAAARAMECITSPKAQRSAYAQPAEELVSAAAKEALAKAAKAAVASPDTVLFGMHDSPHDSPHDGVADNSPEAPVGRSVAKRLGSADYGAAVAEVAAAPQPQEAPAMHLVATEAPALGMTASFNDLQSVQDSEEHASEATGEQQAQQVAGEVPPVMPEGWRHWSAAEEAAAADLLVADSVQLKEVRHREEVEEMCSHALSDLNATRWAEPTVKDTDHETAVRNAAAAAARAYEERYTRYNTRYAEADADEGKKSAAELLWDAAPADFLYHVSRSC